VKTVPANAKNVIGIVEGADPELKDEAAYALELID